MTDGTSVRLRRRSFLAWCSGLGLGSSLFPGTLWAQSKGGAATITSDMIEAVARTYQDAYDFHRVHPVLE
jgi:hypothetical protein